MPSQQHAAVDWPHPILDAVPSAILMIDGERRVVLVNRATERLFGYERSELLGERVEKLVPERYRASHASQVDGFVAAPKARPMGAGNELYGVHKDGREIPIEVGLSPIETAAGPCTLASIVELGARQSAEARFRLAVEASTSAMLMVDRSRQIHLINRRTEELFGYARAELIGQPVELLLPPRYAAQHASFVRDFFAQPRARPMGAGRELFARHRSGREIPVEIALSPIDTPQGPFTLAAIVDISERRRAERFHQQLAAIVEWSEDAIYSTTLDGVIESWNRGAERLFGYSAGEIIGRPVSLLVPPERREEEQLVMERVRRNEPVPHFETRRLRKDGGEVDVSMAASPLRSAAGEVNGASSISRNITELKLRDAELRRSNAELEQFAYVASHDLQEPLRMVANYSELLAERYGGRLDEKADRYIRYAVDGARRMQRLVADLLAYSRVGSLGKPLVPVASQDVMHSVREGLAGLIRESGAQVEYAGLPLVLADEVQLRQLFQNLVGNAIKFRAESPPVVRIAAVAAGSHYEFSVSDNGIGIDLQYADRIFQMFQRLHEVGKYEGSGIGLAIAKRIVERHGGRIWVESSGPPEPGSTFRFTLQRAPGAPV